MDYFALGKRIRKRRVEQGMFRSSWPGRWA